MPSFQGQDSIILQPTDRDRDFSFEFPMHSSEGANDGFLPFDLYIQSCVVTAWKEDGSQVNDLIDSYAMDSTSENTVMLVRLRYPNVSGEGRYSLRFALTLTNGAVVEADFARIRAHNLGYN